MCITPQDDNWAAYNFVCESCGKEFQIATNRDFEKYQEYGIYGLIDDWEDGIGAPICLKCLSKQHTKQEKPV